MNYTENQLKAISHKNGPCLVLAVPGSGKTTVLLERINNLIESGESPNSILAMTFSRAQALDMEQRFINKYGKNIKFSTIHSFAYGIVKMKYAQIGKKLELIESSRRFNKFSTISKMYHDIKKQKMSEDEMETFFRVSGFIKNSLMNYREYVKMYGKAFNGFEKLYDEYETFKKIHDLIDFDDMLVIALKILKSDQQILDSIRNRFKYIQIDEGQDTSIVQLELIYLISKPLNNLFIVADDDQSIYGFRGANSSELLNFKYIFPNAKIYYMEENFRCNSSIVKLSEKLIKNNKKRYSKDIKATKFEENDILIIRAKNTAVQAKSVIKNAIEKISNGENVAILYRNNISSLNLINELNNTDFYIKDAKSDFFNHQVIKDIIDIKNFSIDQYDLKTFERIYYKLNSYIKKSFINEISLMPRDINILERLYECDGVNDFFREKFDLLSFYMDKLSSMNFEKSVFFILNNMGYYEYLMEFARKSNTPIQSFDRIIDTLTNLISGVKTIVEFENLTERFKNIAYTDSDINSKLILSTIHASKGLEFDNVIIIDLINHEFPSTYSLDDTEHNLLEEERRLFYVGMTRAKNSLTLVYPKKINNKDTKPSIFLSEITGNRI